MQRIADSSPWKKFSVRLAALIVAAALGGWAASAVLAPKPSTVGEGSGVAGASAIISPMDLMTSRGRNLPPQEYVEPF